MTAPNRPEDLRREQIRNAKRKLMHQFGLSEAAAYKFIRDVAMETRKPMAVIAQRILNET